MRELVAANGAPIDKLLFLGDINLKGIKYTETFFDRVKPALSDANIVYANLECCLSLGLAPEGPPAFCADPAFGQVLRAAGIDIIGNANNVNFGTEAIRASNRVLEEAGIAHLGSGENIEEAFRATIFTHEGRKYGFLQRTAHFFPHGHAAGPNRPGVATIIGHTAYRPILDYYATATRPGVPPEVITWADEKSLLQIKEEVEALRKEVDFLVVSFHWGYRGEVLTYQREFAHAVIDAGADLIFGHGPHVIAPLERYKGKIIFYGNCIFVFRPGDPKTVQVADAHTTWTGMIARVQVSEKQVCGIELAFVRGGHSHEPVLQPYRDLIDEFNIVAKASASNGVSIVKTEDPVWFRVAQ